MKLFNTFTLLLGFRQVFNNFYLGKFDLLISCGDTEMKPGPRPYFDQSSSICYWNLNSTAAHEILF